MNSMNHQPSDEISPRWACCKNKLVNTNASQFRYPSLFLNHPSNCYFHDESLQTQPRTYCSVQERPIYLLLKYVLKNNQPGEP